MPRHDADDYGISRKVWQIANHVQDCHFSLQLLLCDWTGKHEPDTTAHQHNRGPHHPESWRVLWSAKHLQGTFSVCLHISEVHCAEGGVA